MQTKDKWLLAVGLHALAVLLIVLHIPQADDAGLVDGQWGPWYIMVIYSVQFSAVAFVGWLCCVQGQLYQPQWMDQMEQYRQSGVNVDGTLVRLHTRDPTRHAVVEYTMLLAQPSRRMNIRKTITISDATYFVWTEQQASENQQETIQLVVLPNYPMSGYSLDELKDSKGWKQRSAPCVLLMIGSNFLVIFFVLIGIMSYSFEEERTWWVVFAIVSFPSTLLCAHDAGRRYHDSKVKDLLEEGSEITPEHDEQKESLEITSEHDEHGSLLLSAV